MAVLEGNLEKMQVEETSKKSIRSERYMQKLGTNVNELVKRILFDIGDIMKSNLTEAEFQTEHGVTWVLCDGQNIENTKLNALTGLTTSPDLRGRFLRQVNEASTGLDANRALGTTQGDSNKLHNHLLLGSTANGVGGGGTSMIAEHKPALIGAVNGFGQVTSNTGQPNWGTSGQVGFANAEAETRPQNISLNFFIKVDD